MPVFSLKEKLPENLGDNTALMHAQTKALVPTIVSIPRVEIPPPKLSWHVESATECAAHIVILYTNAMKQVASRDFDSVGRRASVYKAKAYLTARNMEFARELFCAIRELKDGNSRLPLSIYMWWMFQWWYSQNQSIPEIWKVISPSRIRDAKHRRFFWTEVGDSVAKSTILWPKSGVKMLAILDEFKAMAQMATTVDEVVALWEVGYASAFSSAQVQADLEAAEGRRVISIFHERYDLRLYVGGDPLHAMNAWDILSYTLGQSSHGK